MLRRLDDRFRLLTGGRRTALPRQRTLLAALDWSHGLLSPRDAVVFRRLGIFTGDFSLEAASDVATVDDTIDTLEAVDAVASLVAKSLVMVVAEEGRPRYRLLETIRAYALEKLDAVGETNATLRRHAQFFVKLTQQSGRDYYELVSDDEFAARYFADIDNIYRALDWAFGPEGEVAIGVALAGSAWAIAIFRGLLFEHLEWLERAYERLDEARVAPLPRAILLGARATAIMMATPARAVAASDEALQAGEALAGDEAIAADEATARPYMVGGALNSKAMALVLLGRASEAKPSTEALLALANGLPRNRLSANAPATEAIRLLALDDRAAARDLFERALGDLRAIGANGLANEVLLNLGTILRHDDRGAAINHFRDMLSSVRSTHMVSNFTTHVAAQSLAMLLLQRDAAGDLEEARALWNATVKALGPTNTIYGLSPFVVLAAKTGRAREGARVAGFDKAMHVTQGLTGEVLDNDEYSLAALKAALPEAELTALMAEGARMSPDEAFRLVTGIA